LIYFALPNFASAASARFLEIPTDSEGISMGGALSAFASGPKALFWNPAGLALTRYTDLQLTYSALPDSYSVNFLGARLQTGKSVGIGLGVLRISQQPVNVYDDLAKSQGTIELSDTVFQFAAATSVRHNFQLGAGAKYFRSSIGTDFASGLCFDAGFRLAPRKEIVLSGGVKNLGGRFSYASENEGLPTDLYFSLGLERGTLNRFRIVSQLDVPSDSDSILGLGMEMRRQLQSNLDGAIRFGYSNSAQDLSAIRMGFGLCWNRLNFDYAWQPMAELGNLHWLSLGTRW
jgi:hypothetical protein